MLRHRRADSLAGGLAGAAVGIGQFVQRRGKRLLLALHRHAQGGGGLVEQPAPGRMAGDLFLVQQLFQLVGELMRQEHAQIAEPGRIAGQRRVAQLLRQLGLANPVQLQREEQQMRADRRDPLGHRLIEFAMFGVGGIGAEQQLRIGHHPAETLLDPLKIPHGLGELGTAHRGETALRSLRECLGLRLRPGQVRCNARIVRAGIKIAQIPHRQLRCGTCPTIRMPDDFALAHGKSRLCLRAKM